MQLLVAVFATVWGQPPEMEAHTTGNRPAASEQVDGDVPEAGPLVHEGQGADGQVGSSLSAL